MTPSAELAALLESPNLELPEAARADLASGKVDPRMVSMLTAVTKEHKVGLSVIITGHDQFTSGGSVSNHFVGRGIDIASVDGEIVRSNSIAARELSEAIADLPESIRPSEVGTPWSINAPGFFTDSNHQDHLHIAYDDPAPAGFAPPAAPAAAPVAAPVAAATPLAEAPPVQVAEAESEGRKSGVFAGVGGGGEARSDPDDRGDARRRATAGCRGRRRRGCTAPVAPTGGGAFAPVAPEDMANTNEGGKLHASEFDVQDAEGAPGAEGNLHAGYDLFAKAGAPVRSPIEGTIVEVKASRGNTGQIFGGTVKVQGADGRVWVFRHVDPKGVVEGGKVTAGQEIASVTEWTGGAHHAHIELWKTLEGGYNVSNMDDPYVELQQAYAGGGTELPPDVHEHGAGDADAGHEGHDHGGGGELAESGGPAVTPSAELAALLENPNLELPEAARADLASGRVDPRMVSMLTALTKEHKVELVGDHHRARSVHVGWLGLEPLRGSRDRHRERGRGDRAARTASPRGSWRRRSSDLPESIRPSEVGTPWSINAPGLLHRRQPPGSPAHRLRRSSARGLRLARRARAPPPRRPRRCRAPRPGRSAARRAAAPARRGAEAPAHESGVFAGVADGGQRARTAATPFSSCRRSRTKVEQPPEPRAGARPDVGQAGGSRGRSGARGGGYPGDHAPKEQIAAWMATRAKAAGIPPELPVMAALVESRLSNVNYGHADSIGFFQMRTSIWDQGEYAGYGQRSGEADQVVHRPRRCTRRRSGSRTATRTSSPTSRSGATGSRTSSARRRSTAGRYQERLAEARALLAKGGVAPTA